jgi:hypothetical protein
VSLAQTLDEWMARHHGLIVAKNIRKQKAIPQAQLGLPL